MSLTPTRRSGVLSYELLHIRRKAKHEVVETLQVAGWRPSIPAWPGGLLLADSGEPVGVAIFALPDEHRAVLLEFRERYGRYHPTGTITIRPDCIQAVVPYTSCTPTLGHLREAFVVCIEPASSEALSII
jgi:hypothetical protein